VALKELGLMKKTSFSRKWSLNMGPKDGIISLQSFLGELVSNAERGGTII
jgi:hypothetical protein